MIEQILEAYGIIMGYSAIFAMVTVIWNMVIRAFTRGY